MGADHRRLIRSRQRVGDGPGREDCDPFAIRLSQFNDASSTIGGGGFPLVPQARGWVSKHDAVFTHVGRRNKSEKPIGHFKTAALELRNAKLG
jgi:hypothetical protein